MRKIKLIHILLFSFTVTTVVLLGIILASWRLVSAESEESVRNRMQNMLGDTVAAVEERLARLEDGSRIAGSFPEIREFLAGDEQVRFRLKNSVRAEKALPAADGYRLLHRGRPPLLRGADAAVSGTGAAFGQQLPGIPDAGNGF